MKVKQHILKPAFLYFAGVITTNTIQFKYHSHVQRVTELMSNYRNNQHKITEDCSMIMSRYSGNTNSL